MDVGIFLRSRSRLQLWLLTPPTLLVLIAVVGAWYVDRIERQLEWRRSFLEVAPELRAVAGKTRETIRSNFLIFRNNEEAREQLNGIVVERARAVGFTINSMAVDESPPNSGTLRMALHGEGSLVSLLDFANEIQKPEYLLVLDSCIVQLLRRQAGLVYQADFVLRHPSQAK